MVVAPPTPPPPPAAKAAPPAEPKFDAFIKGFYGTLDVSVDGSTKGMDGMVAYHYGDPVNGVYPTTGVKGTPYGPVNWQPAISANAATLGWRGSHAIPGFEDTKFVIQIEATASLTDCAGCADELYRADGRRHGAESVRARPISDSPAPPGAR